ncbi:MAG: phage antirepressor protein [Candidatus Pacebacteria bacterium RIFCSPHIGHO2_01_FULL_46_16]|nr:MAG: phage antirepressor protein [Candidatus Pacebacteria bacterium RIFCSPHIGHO2_01_FULL_46_16]
MTSNIKISIFEGKQVRKTVHQDQWWFAIVDVISALTNSTQPDGYIKDMRRRDPELSKGWRQIATPLPVATSGGMQKINCANTEGIFRIIQSIPSPKAEPFKRWLAKVGYERVQEIEDPELAAQRARAIYKAKGYSDSWIEKRMRGVEIRETLTNEWKKRNVGENREYAILTAEISRATFGMTPSEYKSYKGLKRENLRDHMNDLELIFSMLGEAATTEITQNKNAQGFIENKKAAKSGGTIAGDARKQLETESGKKVSTKQNFIDTDKNKKLS